MTPESIMRGHIHYCLLLMAGKITNRLGGEMRKGKLSGSVRWNKHRLRSKRARSVFYAPIN
jgi:hypothetical protein